jgi:dihydroorotate dehydrogenase electron transfer subunit
VLRRPFSIHKIDYDNNLIKIYYAVVGKGTKLLQKNKADEKISVMGPLGNGFTLVEEKNVFLIGGGMGSAPLLFLAEELYKRNNKISIFLGAGSQEGLKIKDSFDDISKDVYLSTDDGSAGFHGNVIDLLNNDLSSSKKPQIIYACGPTPMLKAVKKFAETREIPCQLSLESMMACGIGVCLGCACQGEDKNYYPKVCLDGPVFWAGEVKLGG